MATDESVVAILREAHPGLPESLAGAEAVEVASPEDDQGFVQVPDDETVNPGSFIRRRLSPETLLAIESDDEEDGHATGTYPLAVERLRRAATKKLRAVGEGHAKEDSP